VPLPTVALTFCNQFCSNCTPTWTRSRRSWR